MKIHIVQKGDTLWKIAKKYGVDFEELKKMNAHLSNPDLIMPGMKIKVPTGGVPVKKEAQKQEKKINIAPKKEVPTVEHPYAEKKPFISFDIEAEINNQPAKENIVPKTVKEAPKEAPKEVPKEPVLETPKAPVAEIKPKEIPKPTMPEAPKAEIKETPKEIQKDLQKAFNVPPLTNVVPPVNISNNAIPNIPNIPPIPPKPANILPEIMKQEHDIESPEKPKDKMKAAEKSPELPQMPYIPSMPQQYLFAQQPAPMPPQTQPCVPVTPVMPGYGFSYQPMPMAPVAYPMYPHQPPLLNPESSSFHFPGINESMSESSSYMPQMPNIAPNIPANNVNLQGPTAVSPVSSEMPMPQAYPAQVNPYVNCVPVTPVMPGYGFQDSMYYQPYMPAVPYGYSAPIAQPYQMQAPPQMPPSAQLMGTSQIPGTAGTAMQPPYMPPQIPVSYQPPVQPYASSPVAQQPPVSPFFMMPEYGESSDYER